MKYYLEEISAVFEDIKSGETGLSSDQAAERQDGR